MIRHYTIVTYHPVANEFCIVDVQPMTFFNFWMNQFETVNDWQFIDYWENEESST